MDDELYRQTRAALDQPRCLYEKAIQYGYFDCNHARKLSLGEREGIHCHDTEACKRCEQYYTLTLSNSGFALGEARLSAHLTFNKAMKVQIGGLQGASKLCHGQGPGVDSTEQPVPDIARCLLHLEQIHGDYRALPFSEIVPCIQQFSLRRSWKSRNRR